MSAVGEYELPIPTGATFSTVVTWRDAETQTPVNLTGYTATLRIGTPRTQALALTVGNGLTLGGAAGTIAVTLSAAQTATLTQGMHFDLELTSGGGEVTRLLTGPVVLTTRVGIP